jgi:hypothetical protein
MNDEVLGTLLPDERSDGALNGAISYRGKRLPLHVEPEEGDLSLPIALARALVGSLSTFDQKARKAAAAALLTTYNESWREFSKAREDGTMVDVSNPPLSESEFMARIELESLEVGGKDICSLWYADGGLFAGHSIFVTSFDGEKFSDLDASLFG